MKQKHISKLFGKWIERLGLNWWNIQVVLYDDPRDIAMRFHEDDDVICTALTSADWKYGSAKISVNFPAWKDVTEEEANYMILHELCHILVNEMHEPDRHHEERVVTSLAKAFQWTVASAQKEIFDGVQQ